MKRYKKDDRLDEIISDIRRKQAYIPLKGRGTKLARRLARKQLRNVFYHKSIENTQKRINPV